MCLFFSKLQRHKNAFIWMSDDISPKTQGSWNKLLLYFNLIRVG